MQDDVVEIFKLDPRRRSPGTRDVDAVKADLACTLNGSLGWFKFGDHNTAVVGGKAPPTTPPAPHAFHFVS